MLHVTKGPSASAHLRIVLPTHLSGLFATATAQGYMRTVTHFSFSDKMPQQTVKNTKQIIISLRMI